MSDYQNIGEMTWGAADGRRRQIKDLTLGHLVNVLNWINDPNNSYPQEFIQGMEKYATDQKFILFSSKKPYPDRIDGKWMIVDPVTGNCKIEEPPKRYVKKVRKLAAADNVAKRIKHLVDRWDDHE